jgi:hypothetical protein
MRRGVIRHRRIEKLIVVRRYEIASGGEILRP